MAGTTLALGLAVGACDRNSPPPNVTFDGARAMEYIKLQTDAGYRIPGTATHRAVADRIVAELKKNADTVIEQTWTHRTDTGDSLPMRNIFAQFNPKATTRILYLSHYDTRPVADNSFANDDKKKPVLGANDGASSTALLLVIAEALKAKPTTIGVDLLFTDGEDYGDFGKKDTKDVLIGARYFVEHPLPVPTYRPTFGVLWDMIGDKDLDIQRETNSQAQAPEVNDRVWKMAAALGYSSYFLQSLTPVTDDHTPFLEKGFPVVDVIDIDYPPHHTTQDTMDKVSAASMEIVGRVAMGLIRGMEMEKK